MIYVREMSHHKLFEDINYVLSSTIVKYFNIDYTYSSLVVHSLNLILCLVLFYSNLFKYDKYR